MSMVNIMKQVAQGVNDSGQGTRFMFGEVTGINPLVVRIENRFDIKEPQIVIMKEFRKGSYPTHYHTLVRPDNKATLDKAGGAGEAAFESHNHELRNDYLTNEGEGSEMYYGLAVGDKLVLLRNQGGQQFVILGRI